MSPSRKYTPPPLPVPKVFQSREEIERGIEKLRRRISAVEKLLTDGDRFDSTRVDTVESDIRDTVLEIFGPQSPEYGDHQYFQITSGPPTMVTSEWEVQQRFEGGVPEARAVLEGLINRLEEKLHDHPTTEARPQRATPGIGHEVFVVHGHDGQALAEVARVIQQIGLEPLIIHERVNLGRTLVEKVETNAPRSGFAVVIMSEDDEGRARGDGDVQLRARQNVLVELGFFYGFLGRSRVLVLRKGNPEMPSDIFGVVYEPIDPAGAWKFKMVQELQAAGFNVSADSLTRPR
ncbi:MAG: hypothetical protein E6K76_06840 [Candidatus Eisenbacteria bacterium]|uniref:CD-NTase-associated protein 12/Pycsar effector protein TIR domain-containing protein n=1 Tax=Eiseniibacteriota bacterium TaxID=2212470 RepID=A0A538T5T6_UNCEI|nr:MAG: hypothetical protein E6K76_06840 [Candidatus Eisenbacteria bacterium]